MKEYYFIPKYGSFIIHPNIIAYGYNRNKGTNINNTILSCWIVINIEHMIDFEYSHVFCIVIIEYRLSRSAIRMQF